MDQLITEGYNKSLLLLQQNLTEHGYQAAPINSIKPEYSYLFGRDSSICALCTLESEDKILSAGAITTLESLRDARSGLGQVPFRVNVSTHYRDFWYPGNLDSTLWWVIAALKLVQVRPDLKESWQSTIKTSLTWLRYQDTAEVGLLMQGQCSDWADEMPNHGAVLYSNALWYRAVEQYQSVYGADQLLSQAYLQQIKQVFNLAFWPYGQEISISNKPLNSAVRWVKSDLDKQPFYISYLSHKTYGRRCDIYANILAMLFGLADQEKINTIEEYLWSIHASDPYPGRSLYPPIYPGEPEWQASMATRNQNLPHQYHNGGIWPFIGGFWVYFLATKQGVDVNQSGGVAEQELLKLAKANALNNWQFNEYLHGQYATPMGIPHQSWNAATYLMAYQATNNKVSLL